MKCDTIGSSDQRRHILPVRGFKAERFAGNRVKQLETAAMKCLAADHFTRPPVKIITDERVSDVRKMHPDLMRPPGVQL